MSIYICADLHFNHKNVIIYDNRPWPDIKSMNEGLISHWNSVVTDKDIVYMLGDVGFCGRDKMKEYVSSLKGYKVLIRGNHDRGRSVEWWEEVGFDEVFNETVLTVGDTTVHLMHEPLQQWPNYPKHFYIYGHVHNSIDFPDWTPHTACVSLCRLNYFPALIEDVISGRVFGGKHG